MGETKRHHYVPQSYLKRFSFDGRKLHTFLIKKDCPKIISEENYSDYVKDISTVDVCVEKDFYSIDENNPNTPSTFKKLTLEKDFFQDNAEPTFQSIVDTFSSLAQQIIDDNVTIASIKITEEQRINLALSAFIQYYRVPRQRHSFDKINNFIKFHQKLHRQESNSSIENVKGMDVAFVHADKTFLNPFLWRSFYKKLSTYYMALRVSKNRNFFTSDNPVVIHNLAAKGHDIFEVNFYKDDFNLFFPLTPYLILEYYSPIAFPDAVYINDSISIVNTYYEDQVNKYQYINAEKFIFSFKNDFSLFLKPITNG